MWIVRISRTGEILFPIVSNSERLINPYNHDNAGYFLCTTLRVPTHSGNHGKPKKSLKITPCMQKSWNLKKI